MYESVDEWRTYVLLLPPDGKSGDELHLLGTRSGRVCGYFGQAGYGPSRV